jgi:hypothetical protein
MTQLTIPENRSKIEDAFWAFHEANPAVYDELVRLAREMLAKGDRFGIATLYEVVRWQRSGILRGSKRPALNNNFRSYYSRLIQKQEPDLDGIFETRRLGVPSHVV